jgi:transcriptional regulator with XRE-family HTH domain
MRHPSARETLPREHRCGYRYDPVMDPKSVRHSAESVVDCSDIRALDHSRIHKDTPALPFCHLLLKAKKPKDSAYPTSLRTLGDHLRAKRLDLGLTQEQLGRQLRVEKMTVNNWETNRKEPAIRLVPNIIPFLGYLPLPTGSSLPERLRAHRLTLFLSFKRLAKRLGVDESSLMSWESGRRFPSIRCLHILENFLRMG